LIQGLRGEAASPSSIAVPSQAALVLVKWLGD